MQTLQCKKKILHNTYILQILKLEKQYKFLAFKSNLDLQNKP